VWGQGWAISVFTVAPPALKGPQLCLELVWDDDFRDLLEDRHAEWPADYGDVQEPGASSGLSFVKLR
jgi:hypothetical protein